MRSVRQLSILIHHLCINDLPTKYLREKFKLTKYTRAKILDHQNTTKKKIWPTNTQKETFWPTEVPREKILDTRNTYQKKFYTHETPSKKFCCHTRSCKLKVSVYLFCLKSRKTAFYLHNVIKENHICFYISNSFPPPPPWNNGHRKTLSFEGFFLKVHQFSLVSL